MYPSIRVLKVLGPVAALLLASCRDSDLPTDAAVPTLVPAAPVFEILDAPRSPLASGFYWLPPMVKAPAFTGTFDAGQSPIVEVCRPLGMGCALPLVAQFTTAAKGADAVRVDAAEEHYIANWNTRESSLDPSQIYRIRVRVAGTQLGYADVKLVKNGGEAKDVDATRYVPVAQGSTLPVKFRIEQGAVPPPGPTRFLADASAGVSGEIGPAGGSLSASFGGMRYTLSVPAGALVDPEIITMTPLAHARNFPLSGGLAAGVRFAPDGLTFLSPATLSIELPSGTSAAGLVAFGYQGSGDPFHLALSSLSGSTLSIPVVHFSGSGAAAGSDADVAALVPGGSVQNEAQAMSALAALLRGARPRGGLTAEQRNEAARILSEWYINSVAPALTAAASSDAALDAGLREYMAWLDAVQRLDVDLGSQEQQARGLTRAALQAGIDRAAADCRPTAGRTTTWMR
jgi:hypothetical protein